MEEKKYINLDEQNILRLYIKTKDGKETGNYLEFDLEDVDLPFTYQEILDQTRKNQVWYNQQIQIIEKKQDFKKKNEFMSNNEKEKLRVLREFLKREKVLYDKFLGKGGVDKLLNGRKFGWTTLKEIDLLIEKQIMPYFKDNVKDIKTRIVEKYGAEEETDVI